MGYNTYVILVFGDDGREYAEEIDQRLRESGADCFIDDQPDVAIYKRALEHEDNIIFWAKDNDAYERHARINDVKNGREIIMDLDDFLDRCTEYYDLFDD